MQDKELEKKINQIEEKVSQIWGVIFGNPDKEKGIIAKMACLEQKVNQNTKLSWTILIVIISTVLGIIIKSIL